ncbi:MAG: hypothetical protein WD512_11820 [Candidatus Paceibacterota bacterium]
MSIFSPKGVKVEYTRTDEKRDSKGYILNPSKCIVRLPGSPGSILTLENRELLEEPWLLINDKEYLVTKAGNSCVLGYNDDDERYKSVVIDCENNYCIYIDLTHWNTDIMLGISDRYDGYDNVVEVVDLSRMETLEILDPIPESFKHFIIIDKNSFICSPDNMRIDFYHNGENEERGIAILLLQYYRIFNNYAWIDEETTFSGDDEADKFNPLAVYSSSRFIKGKKEKEDYEFLAAVVGHIVFIYKEGKLVLKEHSLIQGKTMLKSEFENLYPIKLHDLCWVQNSTLQKFIIEKT